MPAATAAAFAGIQNETEFYSHHYTVGDSSLPMSSATTPRFSPASSPARPTR